MTTIESAATTRVTLGDIDGRHHPAPNVRREARIDAFALDHASSHA